MQHHRTRSSASVVALALLLAACGGGSSSSDGSQAPRSTTSPQPPASEATTTSEPVPEGTVLEPGATPAPWSEATGEAITVGALARPDTGATSVPCPQGISPGASATQCTAYADEGGAYVGLRATTPAGEVTTLYCQAEGERTFEPAVSIASPLASFGPGIADGEGRFSQAFAFKVADGIHWYAVRRPDGEACPVVWDLGVGDGTLAAVSSLGGATYPLADGPSCTRLVSKGLVVKPGSADGICT